MSLPEGTPGSRTRRKIVITLTAREFKALQRFQARKNQDRYLLSQLFEQDLSMVDGVNHRIVEHWLTQ